MPGMTAHACNPSAGQAEAGGSWGHWQSAWPTHAHTHQEEPHFPLCQPAFIQFD